MRFSVGHARGIAVQALGIEPERVGFLAQALVGPTELLPQRRQGRAVRVCFCGGFLVQPGIHGQDGGVGQ